MRELVRALCLVVLAPALALVLAPAQQTQPPPETPLQRLSDADQKLLRKADLVFVGEIALVGAPPGRATGYAVTARQPVLYKVGRVLSGRLSIPQVAVYNILAGGKAQDPDLQKNRLNPTVFVAGKTLVVAASWLEASNSRLAEGSEKPYRYILVNDNDQVLPLEATPATLDAITKLLQSD